MAQAAPSGQSKTVTVTVTGERGTREHAPSAAWVHNLYPAPCTPSGVRARSFSVSPPRWV